jgi:hypothetical protein
VMSRDIGAECAECARIIPRPLPIQCKGLSAAGFSLRRYRNPRQLH